MKVLSYGVIGLLAVALLAGTAYILLSPTEAQGQGPIGGQGAGQSRGREWQADVEPRSGAVAYGQGRGQGRGVAGGELDDNGRGQGTAGQSRNEAVSTVEWETLIGKVILVDGEVIVQTDEGEVSVGMGQSAYREGFALQVGDEVSVTGFYEDGEFKAGTVENLTTGESIVLRDEFSRPMWSGRGRANNRG